MSTLALVGLLVVLLVAIGIAGFLLRGRRGASADPDAPPRTVAELVDRRRASGPEDGTAAGVDPSGVDPAVDADGEAADGAHDRAAAEDGAAGAVEHDGTTPIATSAGRLSETAVAPQAAGSASPDAVHPDTAGPDVEPDGSIGSGRSTAGGDAADAGAAAVPGAGPREQPVDTSADADATVPADGTASTDTPSPTPRPGSDADTGASSPPWSRGFVGGRQITPPVAEKRTDPADESTRPSPPPRQESRSPVDPDLVKRVTSVPSTGARRSHDPDTEREFREARDRMAGPVAGRHSRVPEQSTRSPEPGATAPPRPTPSRRDRPAVTGGVAAGLTGAGIAASALSFRPSGTADGPVDDEPAATGTDTGARPSPFPRATDVDAGPGDEPPPRPAPRVMRSTGALGTTEPAEPTATGPTVGDPAATGETTDPAADGGSGAPVVEPAHQDPDRHDADRHDTGSDTTVSSAPAVTPGTAEEEPVAFAATSAPRPGPVPSTPAQDVEVEVGDRSHRPLAGVALSTVDSSGAPAGVTTTGADGTARLRAPGAGRYLLVASADGFETRVTPYAVADETVRVPITLTRSSSLHGTAGAGVSVVLSQDGDEIARTDSGTDGAFRFADLGAGHYRLSTDRGPGSTVHVPAETDVEHDVRAAEETV